MEKKRISLMQARRKSRAMMLSTFSLNFQLYGESPFSYQYVQIIRLNFAFGSFFAFLLGASTHS